MLQDVNAQITVANLYEIGKLKMKFPHCARLAVSQESGFKYIRKLYILHLALKISE